MNEYLTDALILDTENSGEMDKIIYLYTPDLGKVVARAKSARKITSKLAGHLEPLFVSKVRLVEKNGVQIIDAVKIRQLERKKKNLELLRFLKEMTFEFQPDKKLWLSIKKSLEDIKNKKFSYKPLLEILGFDPKYAECNLCQEKNVKYFSVKEHVFLCESHGLSGFLPANEKQKNYDLVEI